MLKILTIVGARPQFIKAAAISHAIRDLYADRIEEHILHTGQHYDQAMSGNFFSELDIPAPHYNLGVGSGTHAEQTARMLVGIEQVLASEEHYDGMIVYGDTNSTLAGALAAAKMQVPVYHIEAGLRSFNRSMPEEINRIATDHISTLLFAPTRTAENNLRKEGFDERQIHFSGDVMLDNVRHYLGAPTPPTGETILATVHRDFNTDHPNRLTSILSAINDISSQHHTRAILPCHPRTRKMLDTLGTVHAYPNIELVQPLSYLQTLEAIRQSHIVLTDSGGLQKEAYFCGRPCVILRPETEWTEIVASGSAITADADPARIAHATSQLWNHKVSQPSEFGDGRAATHILDAILQRAASM